ncbi:MAG: hypothetical protein K6G73_05210 [Marinilabiliaceae bacterium]|nr:hypothetical protein [Marinilabiliaceae bacterium]
MKFYCSSDFRKAVEILTKKPKNGYGSVIEDICKALSAMPDNILRDTNERIIQTSNQRTVKLRVANSLQNLTQKDGFRLVYLVETNRDRLVLLYVYPKRGALAMNNIGRNFLGALLQNLTKEINNLEEVDVNNHLSPL